MTRTCQHPGCTADISMFGHRRKYCEPHREEVERETIKRNNRLTTEKRKEARKATPLLCRVPGCDGIRAKPRDHYCPGCREKVKKGREKVKVQLVAESKPEVAPWVPKPNPIVFTGEEMARLNRTEEKRLEQVRARLDPRLMMARVMCGALVAEI